MSVTVGTMLYQQQTYLDRNGIEWVRLLRCEVTVTGEWIRTTPPQHTIFPRHTPPASADEIPWQDDPGASAVSLPAGEVGKVWTLEHPELPEPEVLPDGTEANYLAYKADCYAAKQQGRPQPQLSDADLRALLIHEHREGLKAWR